MIFLFTEIDHPALFKERGSPEADHVLACEYFLIEEILHAHGAHWIKRTPLGVVSAFEGGDAAKAAIALQKDFQGHLWDKFDKAKIRVALHSGEAEQEGQSYVSPDVNHTAKLLEIAWGGQILLTIPAVHFIPLPPGSRLVDMGKHFLKDLTEPGNIYSLQHPDLTVEETPPLKSLQVYPNNLFPQSSAFFGRQDEIREIDDLLTASPVRLITLLGPGGFGKTRLALQCAAEVIDQFKDGVFLVPLAPLLSDELIVGSIANAAKFLFYGSEDPKTQLLAHLKDKQMLLVMDNFEHIIEGARLIEEILQAAPRVRIIVTSRESLRVGGERVFEVRGMRYPEPGQIEGMDAFGAIQLFQRSAKKIRPDFSMNTQERESLIRICRLLEGMPLGLELSATWVGSLSLAEIADKIESSRDFLATSMPHLPPRHRSLRAVFEYSWILLSEAQKKTLKALSVFKGGFDIAAARLVAGASAPQLEYLENKSLVRRVPGGRYDIHELLKYYAKEKLFDDPAEKETAFDAHCAYFCQFLKKTEGDLRGPSQRKVLDGLVGEMGNIREAWKRAVEKTREKDLGDCLGCFYAIFETKGWFREGQETFEWAAGSLRTKYPRVSQMSVRSKLLLARVTADWASFESDLGRAKKAESLFKDSLDLFRVASAMNQAGFAWSGMAVVTETQGDYHAAKIYYEKALKAYRQAKDRPGIVWALNNLGHNAISLNHFEKALALIRQSLKYAQEDKDRRGMAYSYNLLGDTSHALGRFAEAKTFFQKGLEAFLETEDRRGVGWSFKNLGRVAESVGDYAGARQMYLEGLAISQDIGNRRGLAWANVLLGNLGWATGDFTEGWKRLQEGLAIYREVGDLRGEAWALDLMGNLKLALREDQEAEKLYLMGYSLTMKEGANSQNVAWNYFHLGAVSFFRGQMAEAKGRFLDALGHFQRIGDRLGQAVTFIHLGEIACEEKDYVQAEKKLKHALKLGLEVGSGPVLVDAMAAAGKLLKLQGEESKAISFLMVALSHPTCRQQTKDRMVTLAMELESHFSPQEVEGGFRWAKSVKIEAVAAGWISTRMEKKSLLVGKKAKKKKSASKSRPRKKSKRKK
jgi:predicted ATPase